MLKEANVSWDETIIAATSDKKTSGNRFLDIVSNGYTLIITGTILVIITVALTLYTTVGVYGLALIDMFFGGAHMDGLMIFGIIYYTIAFFVGAGGIVAIFYGIRQRSRKGNTYLILYTDHMLYKCQQEYNTGEKSVPFSKMHRCFVQPTQKTFRSMTSWPPFEKQFYVNFHIEYDAFGSVHYVSLPLSNRYEELNQIITYLQHEQNIPVYFTDIKLSVDDSFKNFDSTEIEHFRQIEGNIESYI